jgi:hypothetical protein
MVHILKYKNWVTFFKYANKYLIFVMNFCELGNLFQPKLIAQLDQKKGGVNTVVMTK